MKKLFLSLIVMVAFATVSSYAYTPRTYQWVDYSRAWVAAEGGASISLNVTLPSGYGWTSIQFVMIANRVGDYVYGYSWGGNVSAYGPCPYKPANVPYYAGSIMTLVAYSGSTDGFAQISAYYIK